MGIGAAVILGVSYITGKTVGALTSGICNYANQKEHDKNLANGMKDCLKEFTDYYSNTLKDLWN